MASPGTDPAGDREWNAGTLEAACSLLLSPTEVSVLSTSRRQCKRLKRESSQASVLPRLAPPHFPTTAPMMQPREKKRARLLPIDTLDVLDNDLLFRCASYLDADGLARIGWTSAVFGIPQAGQQRSLVNESARQRFQQGATDEERSRLPKYENESDVGLCRALEQLRKPLGFDELVGDGFGPQENPASVK